MGRHRRAAEFHVAPRDISDLAIVVPSPPYHHSDEPGITITSGSLEVVRHGLRIVVNLDTRRVYGV